MGELKLENKVTEGMREELRERGLLQMRLVVDANELFAGIIAKGKKLQSQTLDILFSDDVELFAPFRLLAELEKNYALALKLDCPIGAQEKAFKKQTAVDVFSTKDLIEIKVKRNHC